MLTALDFLSSCSTESLHRHAPSRSLPLFIPTSHALIIQDLHQIFFTMSVLRATFRVIAQMSFHAAIALALVAFTLDVFAPNTFVAAQNAANDILRPLTTGLPHIEMDLLIRTATSIIATVWSPCRAVGRSLGSTGAALVYTVQQSSWTDLMEDAQTRGQWVKAWLSILTNFILTVNDTAVGRLLLLVAAISLINNILALIQTVSLLATIATSIMRLVYRTLTYILHLLTRIVTFFCRFLGNVVAFIYSLF